MRIKHLLHARRQLLLLGRRGACVWHWNSGNGLIVRLWSRHCSRGLWLGLLLHRLSIVGTWLLLLLLRLILLLILLLCGYVPNRATALATVAVAAVASR